MPRSRRSRTDRASTMAPLPAPESSLRGCLSKVGSPAGASGISPGTVAWRVRLRRSARARVRRFRRHHAPRAGRVDQLTDQLCWCLFRRTPRLHRREAQSDTDSWNRTREIIDSRLAPALPAQAFAPFAQQSWEREHRISEIALFIALCAHGRARSAQPSAVRALDWAGSASRRAAAAPRDDERKSRRAAAAPRGGERKSQRATAAP
jgi:hypothetical protein